MMNGMGILPANEPAILTVCLAGEEVSKQG